MFLYQFKNANIGQSSYYVESDGMVAIVDPEWDCSPYLKLAEERGAKIDYVFLTKIQEFYLTGHSELAERTGCQVVVGQNEGIGFRAHLAKDEEVFQLGNTLIQALSVRKEATSLCCFLLFDESEYPFALFSGDLLSFQEVQGKSGQASESSQGYTDLIEQQFELISARIVGLPDYVLVLPTKEIKGRYYDYSKIARWNTLRNVKDEFPEILLDKQDFRSQFQFNIIREESSLKNAVFSLNKEGLPNFTDVVNQSLKGLSPAAFKFAVVSGVVILDFRNTNEFVQGSIKGSIHVERDGRMENWIQKLISNQNSLLIVAPPGTEIEIISRLALIGYFRIIGFLDGGIQSWINVGFKLEELDSFSWEEFKIMDENEQYIPLDVRTRLLWKDKHLRDGLNIPLEELGHRWTELSKHQGYALICSDGYRSVIASSFLKSKGYTFIVNIKGGIDNLSNHLLKFAKT